MDESLVVTGAVLCAAGTVFGAIAIKAQRDHRRWCEGKARVDGVVSRLVRRPRPGRGHSNPTGVASGREPSGVHRTPKIGVALFLLVVGAMLVAAGW